VWSARARAGDIGAVEEAAALGWGSTHLAAAGTAESSPGDFAASTTSLSLRGGKLENAMVSHSFSRSAALSLVLAYRLFGKALFGTWAGSAGSRQAQRPPTDNVCPLAR